jgi:endonuclease/exonuclease/phosphatase family metal-dependent hydrolase
MRVGQEGQACVSSIEAALLRDLAQQARLERNMMRLISWNTAHKTSKCTDQVKALLHESPDVVALQEVLKNGAVNLCDLFKDTDLSHVVESFQIADSQAELKGHRQYGELVASRWPLRPLPPTDFPVPWTERVLSVIIATPSEEIELHTTHIPPGSSNGWKKIEMLEGIYKRLACLSRGPRILCGDFNTPREELAEGQVVTWAQAIKQGGRIVLRKERGQRWDDGERKILTGLAEFDLADVFRRLHGYTVKAFSWIAGNGKPRRFDHVFASAQLRATQCDYLHILREGGMSDHSAIAVTFDAK